jgi:hypothetical protein
MSLSRLIRAFFKFGPPVRDALVELAESLAEKSEAEQLELLRERRAQADQSGKDAERDALRRLGRDKW